MGLWRVRRAEHERDSPTNSRVGRSGLIPLQTGESLDDLAVRADRVIARVRAVDGDVALFGHSHALRVLTARWLGLAPIVGSGFILETGAIGVLGWDREFPACRSLERSFAICGPTNSPVLNAGESISR